MSHATEIRSFGSESSSEVLPTQRGPAHPDVSRQPSGGRGLVISFLAVLTLAILVFAYASWRAGSPRYALQYLAGARLIVTPTKVTVSGRPDDLHEIVLRNLTESPVRIVGYNATCSCVRLANLPVQIPPAGRARISLYANAQAAEVVPVVLLADRAMDVPPKFTVEVVPGGADHGETKVR